LGLVTENINKIQHAHGNINSTEVTNTELASD